MEESTNSGLFMDEEFTAPDVIVYVGYSFLFLLPPPPPQQPLGLLDRLIINPLELMCGVAIPEAL